MRRRTWPRFEILTTYANAAEGKKERKTKPHAQRRMALSPEHSPTSDTYHTTSATTSESAQQKMMVMIPTDPTSSTSQS
ncbi:hypothetical protein CEXT_474671 [Caerostris extrusa]|uniref:Uncharacterized protein n=1 Tax=Caerostris extrusa TaxID=172846 RepID=A0AAV4TB19_CAEEX|nr:hypothetical protein CEXT_474671 [Caerostris extrusa]